jgi:hypothetical protein
MGDMESEGFVVDRVSAMPHVQFKMLQRLRHVGTETLKGAWVI